MPLPTPHLDDRHFQDIVDDAKKLIPQYCPEWTDHNVSDPGVTLIELFAWMTDLLLYRVNQVPDKVYIKLLEMIGIRLQPPRAARAPVTFYLSAAQPNEITLPEGTEVATVQTENSPAIVFTTENDLVIRPPTLVGAFTTTGRGVSTRWARHDLGHLAIPDHRIAMFPRQPAPGDAFCLAFRLDHSNHVLRLALDCDLAGGAGVDPTNPPIEWQVWQGGANRWVSCELEHDGTGGFNYAGDIVIRTPGMVRWEFEGTNAFWLRCLLTEAQAGQGGYKVSPELKTMLVESKGGTTTARHAITVEREVLGHSDGTPGQTFHLLHTPVLARDPNRDHLVVEPPGPARPHTERESEAWQEVDDFADSGAGDRHYVLDSLDGTVTLGPSLIQPGGNEVYRFGAVPPKGSLLIFSRYQYGGGVNGNVTKEAIRVLKSSIPYVSGVKNWQPATGGRPAESLEEAKLRAPQALRAQTRAVTADDYEYLARVDGVARASCLTPGAQPGAPGDPKPGQVFVVVLPQVDRPEGYIPLEQMALSADLHTAVLQELNKRRLLGTTVEVRPPRYIGISVQATLRVPERSSRALKEEVQRLALSELYRYLNPYRGGPNGTGWPFGRALYMSEVYALLQRVPSVDFVESVQISVREAGTSATQPYTQSTLSIPRDAVIYSNQHQVRLE